MWGKDTGDKLSLLEVVPPLLPAAANWIETKRRRNARYRTPDYAKVSEKVEHLLLILNKGEPDFEERKEAEKYPDIWFFDIKAGQLYIYEYQSPNIVD